MKADMTRRDFLAVSAAGVSLAAAAGRAAEPAFKTTLHKAVILSKERMNEENFTKLKEAGMEVVYLGMYQHPAGIVQAAIDEDADVIGVSYLSGEHLVFTPKIVQAMKEKGGTLSVNLSTTSIDRDNSITGNYIEPGHYLKLSIRKISLALEKDK